MNLLKEIFERLEYESLLSEGKDPVEILRYKYSNVPGEVIDKLVSIDPTKKKSYSQWALSHWDDERDTILNALKNGRLEKLFQFVKNNNDVQLKGFRSVEIPLNEYIPDDEGDYDNEDKGNVHDVLRKSSAPVTLLKNNGWEKQVPSELANDFDIVFNDDDWVIAVPNTYEADCKLGENMQWCTAGGLTDFKRGRDYYHNYLREGGKYYVNFDMTEGESRLGVDYPFTRYQFHFETKQFKDKEDDDVDVYNIGMPESAKEYYLNEGYDEEDFMNEEERMEAYEDERHRWNYGLANELYLGMEYDNDYNFEEPTETTDFYIFSYEDDRDPICWDSLPNPHVDDSFIKEHNDGYVILQRSNDDYLLCASEPTNWGDSNWSVYNITGYLKDDKHGGVFAISDKETLCYWDENGPGGECVNVKVSDCSRMFINNYCGNDGRFIEIIGSDEFHSLFMLKDGEIECIIKNDIPLDGDCYSLDEDGVIRGKYGIYRVDGESVGTDVEDSEGNISRYHFEEEFDDGLYTVSISQRNAYGNYMNKYNVITKWGEKPLFKNWYDDILNYKNGIFVIKRESVNVEFIDIRENQIGGEYNNCGFIGNNTLVGVGRDNSPVDIIDVSQKRVIARFKSLVTNQHPNNCLLLRDENGSIIFYNYDEQRVVDFGLDVIDTIGKYYVKQLYCRNKRSGNNCIVNINDLSIAIDGISDMSMMENSYDEAYLLTKVNGKQNVFAQFDGRDATDGGYRSYWSEVLPDDVDGVSGIVWWCKMIYVTNNGRYYIYKFKDGDNRYIINPNGFPVQGNISGQDGYVWFDSGSFEIGIYPDNGRLKKWRSMNNWGSDNFPPEVIDFYNKIVGNEPSPSNSSAQEPAVSTVGESFMRFMKRLNEADRLRRNVIYD